MAKKRKEIIGVIKGNELLAKRKGKVNLGSNPEIKGHIHKSLKDYDRNKEKEKVRNYIKELGY